MIDEINNMQCVKNRLSLSIQRGGFVKIARICDSHRCSSRLHKLGLSEKIWKILGVVDNKRTYANGTAYVIINDNETIIGNRLVNLAESLPNMFMVYSNLLEPYMTRDV